MRRSPWFRAWPVQRLSSLFRRTVRWKLIPQAGASGEKLSVRNGISISATHPMSLRRTRAVQMPSHCRLFWPPLPISESPIRPDGLISKK